MFTWMKRISFFLITNFLIMITISIILRLTGLDQLLAQTLGGGYLGLFGMCLIYGMVFSFISLWMSKGAAKRAYRLEMLDEHDTRYDNLVARVHQFAQSAGLEKMPEVGVYDSEQMNAFATGPSKKNSLVAVSTGLMNKMNRGEVDGVLAHEVAHIANGDMVTMTLVQGVMNAFVMFFAQILSSIIMNAMRGENDRSSRGGIGGYFLYMVIQSVLGFFAMFFVAFFSRKREFRADAGGAKLAGSHNMISALQALQREFALIQPSKADKFQAMKISSKNGIMKLLSTHPPLESRIQELQNNYQG